MPTDKPLKLSNNEKLILHGDIPNYFASGKSASTSLLNKSPDAEYKQALQDYTDKKKTGSLTDAQDIKSQATLNKLKVGSTYDKNVRDLYGLTKTQISTYLSTTENGKDKVKISEQLKAYDQAHYDSGANTTLKFKYGFGVASKGGRKSSGRSGGGRTGRAKIPKTLATTPKLKTFKQPKVKGFKVAKAKAPKFAMPKSSYSYKTPKVPVAKKSIA